MSDAGKVFWCSLPILLIGAVALLMPVVSERLDQWRLEELRSAPLSPGLRIHGEEIRGRRHTYSSGSYGVAEIGALRMVFEKAAFPGSSDGSMMLGRAGTNTGLAGGSGTGGRSFIRHFIAHGTRCEFAGATFDFIAGELHFDGQVIDATDPPTFIRISPEKKIVEITPIR